MCSTANCWASFSAPFVVKQSEAPYYRSASVGILVAYMIKLVVKLLLLGKVMLISPVL